MPQIPANILLSTDRQSPFFYRINIEYFCLYNDIKPHQIREGILKGLNNNLMGANTDLRSKSTQWKPEHDKILVKHAIKLSLEVTRYLKQLPIAALRRLPPDIQSVKLMLVKTPNDHLSHFHLGWLYTVAKNFTLAERHFNVAALQSQSINPQLSCFAYRHLANAKFKNGKFSQALLAIETACELNQSFNPELLFERIRFLSTAQRTTQALPHLAGLVSKAPHYEAFVLQDPDILLNPSLRLLFRQTRDQHINNVQQQLLHYWKNDPLNLLDLDKELGQKNSIRLLQDKQREMLTKLSPLLLFNEDVSFELIKKRSRSIIIRSLNIRKQQYIERIEDHQECAGKLHSTGQWMLYAAVVSIIALGLSYAISSIAFRHAYDWPINLTVQSIVLTCAFASAVTGAILLHFTPRKLSDLVKQRRKLEELSLRLGVSAG